MTDAVGARNFFKVDAGVVHALLQARYYDGSKGEFLSEDPVFLGNPKQQVLTDPQSLNSYSYANDNPITKSDPTGKFVPEALVGAGIGGLVGFTLQGATDLATGRLSSPEAYAGAFAGGAAFGGIVGATDGLSLLGLVGAGGVSAAVQSGTTQGLSLADGSQSTFSYSDFTAQTAIGAITGPLPGLRIGRVTAGRGSYVAVQNQMYTKLGTGSLVPSQISMPTYGKMFVATAAQQAPGGAAQGVLSKHRLRSQNSGRFCSGHSAPRRFASLRWKWLQRLEHLPIREAADLSPKGGTAQTLLGPPDRIQAFASHPRLDKFSESAAPLARGVCDQA